MSYIKFFFLLLFLSASSVLLFGQGNYPECVNPKKINLPLPATSDDNRIDEIYYQPLDKYTYWYKLTADIDCRIYYKMSLINQEDNYELLIYKYQGKNFCNDLVKNEVKPISNRKESELELKKGELLYLNVVYINGKGCGHTLKLETRTNTMIVKAIQNECVEEAIEEVIAEDTLAIDLNKEQVFVEAEPIKEVIVEATLAVALVEKQVLVEAKPVKETELADTLGSLPVVKEIVVEELLQLKDRIKGLVINSNTKKSIEAVVSLLEYKGVKSRQIISKVDSGFTLENCIEDKVVVQVTKFGYENLLDTINLLEGDFEVTINPIGVGQKLIMEKIYFHPNTYVLKGDSKKELEKLLNFIVENEDYVFQIQGHTNGNRTVKMMKQYAHLGEGWNYRGSSKKLSKLRAEKIKTYLIKNGVLETQLETEGYGGDRMIVEKPKNMKEAMKNIRVEVVVVQ